MTNRGFVASDALFQILDDRIKHDNGPAPIFPLIQGILAFDTPYNGLARSMFVYGAFSNYQKVSSVFNVMTALSAAPAGLSMALKRGATSLPGASSSRSLANPAWKTWQLVAVRTGTVGAIAAGGVAAYVHRRKIVEGVQSVRNLNKQSVMEGYQQGVDRLGQGLAYVNRGNVGRSFAWLSDHFTFVGVLLKQAELSRRLERLAALQGVGVHDFYCSMGENGYWSGGYFVPERTFCAVPLEDQPAHGLFSRHVVKDSEDEVQAHVSMFDPQKNEEYQVMTEEAAGLVIRWFNDESDVVDDPKFAEPAPSSPAEDAVKATDEGIDGIDVSKVENIPNATESADDDVPDESPVDIAAAASLVPLPDDSNETSPEPPIDDAEKRTYMRYLMSIAQQAGTGIQQAGTGLKDWIPSKIPGVDGISKPNLSNVSMPSFKMFGKKQTSSASDSEEQNEAEKLPEKDEKASAAEPDAGVAQPVVHEETEGKTE
jgi:hypothetical protein